MDKRTLLQATFASLLAGGLMTAAHAATDANAGKEKCYGVAKAGHNDCASVSGSHSCAGSATKDNDAGDWKYVAKGTCDKLGGVTTPAKK